MTCEKCGSSSVRAVRELISPNDSRRAKWYCDDCKHMWAFQPQSAVYYTNEGEAPTPAPDLGTWTDAQLVCALMSLMYRLLHAGGLSGGRSLQGEYTEAALHLLEPHRPAGNINEWPTSHAIVRAAKDRVHRRWDAEREQAMPQTIRALQAECEQWRAKSARDLNPKATGSIAWQLSNRTAERDALQAENERLKERNTQLEAMRCTHYGGAEFSFRDERKAKEALEQTVRTLTEALTHLSKFSASKSRQFNDQAFGDSRVEDAARVCEDISLIAGDALSAVDQAPKPEGP